ncbi:MAG: hypothetical protein ACXW31_08830 [Thermoanaerobaculia bacterium]
MLCLLFASFIAISVWPQTVVQRARLGHVVEDLDTVDKFLAVLDGQEVFLEDAKGRFEKLFDVRDGGADHCTGFAYVPTEKAFLVLDSTQRDRFFVFDRKGAPLGTRPIAYLGGLTPIHVEALTYLGKGTPYPDHVAFLVYDTGMEAIDVARLDGTVVLHIPLPPPLADAVYGMASTGGGGFYVIGMGNLIYTVDYSGQITAGPVRIEEVFGVEGITIVGERLYVQDFLSGKAVAFDTNLQRQPADDLRNDFGVGLPGLVSIAWNSDAGRYVVLASGPGDIPLWMMAWQVVSSLDDARPMFFPRGNGFLRPRGMSFMPDEHKIAVAHLQPQRAILIYSPQGDLLEQIDVTPVGRPSQVAWIPSTQEFYVRTLEMPATLRVLSRTGALLRDVDFSALGPSLGAIAHVDGQLLLFAGGLLYRTDLAGGVVASYDPAPLNVVLPTICAVTTGPHAGKFAATSSRNTELVVFSLP